MNKLFAKMLLYAFIPFHLLFIYPATVGCSNRDQHRKAEGARRTLINLGIEPTKDAISIMVKMQDGEYTPDEARQLIFKSSSQSNLEAFARQALINEGHDPTPELIAAMLDEIINDKALIDDEEARKELEAAANDGDATAQGILGTFYLTGERLEIDHEKGIYWLTKGAEQGDALAQLNLGSAYGSGTGVKQDSKRGIYWVEKAARQGHPQAEYMMGRFYLEGIGVDVDQEKSLEWFARSAEQGYPDAVEVMKDFVAERTKLNRPK